MNSDHRLIARFGSALVDGPGLIDGFAGQPPTTTTEQVTVSIDLVILGEEPKRFRAYDHAIRKEYSWVPIATYRQERARVLGGFLTRSTIFPLPWFEKRYGRRARFNLRQALACLDLHSP